MGELDGRVAIVTGSSSGIGAETARRLAALGASVIVNSASSVETGRAVAEEVGGTYVQADISDRAQCDALVEAALSAHGRLDVLVNNAGWTTVVAHDDLDALTDEIFRRTFDVNVFGTWWLTKAAMPHLKRSPDGNVVNITSLAGIRPTGSSIAYAMTKAALNHMTLLLARSQSPVRVNAVAPGLVDTPWTADWDDRHAAIARMVPAHRSATPADCAEAVLALVRNTYVTGHVFLVDGGSSLVL